jgi:hypothetical protein
MQRASVAGFETYAMTPLSGFAIKSASIRNVSLARRSTETTDRRRAFDVEERRAAPPHGLAGGAFGQEVSLEQVVDDEGDGGAADAHGAREIGTGDGLVGANQVQDDAAVDLAAGAARRDLEPGRVDASHGYFVKRFDKIGDLHLTSQ